MARFLKVWRGGFLSAAAGRQPLGDLWALWGNLWALNGPLAGPTGACSAMAQNNVGHQDVFAANLAPTNLKMTTHSHFGLILSLQWRLGAPSTPPSAFPTPGFSNCDHWGMSKPPQAAWHDLHHSFWGRLHQKLPFAWCNPVMTAETIKWKT
jgi:hypothetical protein